MMREGDSGGNERVIVMSCDDDGLNGYLITNE